jgi:biopolymer transport protein ExbD
MAMTTTARDGEPMSEINTTPLIDVMLVLLIMLIVTLPPRRDQVKLDLPRPAPVSVQQANTVEIALSEAGDMAWNGEAVTEEGLEAKLRAASLAGDPPEIRVHPSRLTRYASVIAVMAAIQRHGISRMGVITES